MRQSHVASTFFALIAACALFCIFNAYTVGKSEGRDAKIIYGAFNDLTAMAIAISEDRYGFHEGYIGRPEVIDALGKFLTPDGLMIAPEKYAALAGDRNVIEAALRAAISLDPSTFSPFKAVREPFVVMFGEDTGLVNFYRLSFALFGYHADSMYQCYFLLLLGSALLFFWQARKHLVFATAGLSLLYAFQTLFYLDSFTTLAAPAVYCNRLFGTLGLLATLHIMLFTFMPNRYDKITGILWLLLQAALLLFVMTVRSSTAWQWITIMLWLAAPVLHHCWHRQGLKTAPWPALILLIALYCMSTIQQRDHDEAHDDIYFTDCTMNHHLRWHSAYLGLDIHPDWPNVAPSETRGEFYGDGAAWNAARTYWKRKHDEERYSCKLFPAFPPFGIHDFIMRKLYAKFAGSHPRYMAQLYFIYKPLVIFNGLKTSLMMLPGWWWKWVACAALASAAAGAACRHISSKHYALAAAALTLLLLMSNMPAIFAYPSYLVETLMLLLACMAFIPCAAAALLTRKAFGKADARLPAERM